ncbi:MAG: flagellar protein FlgN [Schwartzia sp. (in: firmicutes)]
MWQEFVKVLGKLTAAYERLAALAQEKQAALAGVDMERLEQLLGDEKRLLDEIEHLEFGRQQILAQLAREVPALREAATMEAVGQYSPADLRPWILRLHRQLDEAVSKVKTVGKTNEFLIQSALSAVRYHLNRLGNSVVEPTYGGKGQEVVSQHTNFDFQA